MFMDTWTEAQPMVSFAVISEEGKCLPQAGTARYQCRTRRGAQGGNSPSSGYSLISSSPIAVTSTLKAKIITCRATKELNSSDPFHQLNPDR